MVSVSQNPTKDISDIISAVMIFNEIILEWIFGTNFCEIIFLSRDIIITQCVRNNYPPNCLIDVSPIGSIEGRNNQNAICQTTRNHKNTFFIRLHIIHLICHPRKNIKLPLGYRLLLHLGILHLSLLTFFNFSLFCFHISSRFLP